MKIASSGAPLGEEVRVVLDALCANNPQWQLTEDERDEFPSWMGDDDKWRRFVATPRRRRELVEWLKQHPGTSPWQEDDWRQRCRDEFATTACALCVLSREDFWPVGRWREAIQAWEEEKLLKRSWRYMAPVLARAPVEIIGKLAYNLSWWLKSLAKTFVGHHDLFFALCEQILSIDHQDEMDSGDPVTQAVNHPVGKITEALLHWWYRRDLKDDQGLPGELKPIFTRLCGSQIPAYRHARVLLAARVVVLFRVDPEWTKRNLLLHFDWQRSTVEARATWEGFLWSPRLYTPLFELIKPMFLDVAKHYAELEGIYGRQYAALLTFAALEPPDIFAKDELKVATVTLPEAGRQEVLRTLMVALEGADEQRAEYWRNRIVPYWKSIWPKSRDYRTQALSVSLAELCIAARSIFTSSKYG